MTRRISSVVVVALLALPLICAACGGGGGGAGSSEMALDVDGVPVDTTILSVGPDVAGNTLIAGGGDDWSIDIRFPGQVAGTFSSEGTGSAAEVTYTDADGNSFVASDVIAGSSYVIDITAYDSQSLTGTLTLTLVGPGGATHTITGTFTVAFIGINQGNPYEGIYMGIFRVQGQVQTGTQPDPPYDPIWGPLQTYSFRVTIELDHLATAAGSGVYFITHANVSDPFFACQVAGCDPAPNTSVATLPVPPGTPTPSGPSQAGQGISVDFPNGSSLMTDNGDEELYTSTDGRTLSNALGLVEPWLAMSPESLSYVSIKFGTSFDGLKSDTRSMTWAMTKSAL